MGTTVVVATLKTPFNTNVVFGFESSDEDEPPGKLAFFCYTHTPFRLFIFLVMMLVLIECSGNAPVPSVVRTVPVIPATTSAHLPPVVGTTVVVATLKTPFNTNVVFGFESSDEDEPPGKLAFFCYTHTPFRLFIFLVMMLVLIECSGNAPVPSVGRTVPVIPATTSARPNSNIPVFILISLTLMLVLILFRKFFCLTCKSSPSPRF